ncbi:multidrug resistance-like protein [Xylariaceae sp. FL1651]|nr:multidrug resistance-like protein [Xylariaceae sp. FL1651]
MSNSTSFNVGCLPTADAAFGPIIGRDDDGGNCRSFDFTIAFEQYFFSIAPAVILIIAAPLRLRYLSKSPSLVAGNFFRLTKVAAIAIFAAFQLSLVAVWAAQSTSLGHIRTVSLAASSVSFVASLLICGLSYTEHARSLRPSFILNAYLLVSLLLDAATVRSFWLSSLSTTLCTLFTISFVLKAGLLVLEAVEKASFIKNTSHSRSNPEVTSGLYSRGLVWWMNPLLLDGFRRLLRPDDLYSLDESMSAAVLHEAFWAAWDTVNTSSKYRLILSCLKALKWPLVGTVVPRLLLLAFTISQPLVLRRFLTFLQDPGENVSIGYGLIGAYGLVYIGIALSSAFYQHQNSRTLTMLRGILVSAVFSRSTDLSTTDIDNSAAVTLMSTDVDAIIRAWRELHELWASTIQIVLAIWLLSTHIGFASVGPVIVCGFALATSISSGPYSKRFMMAWISKVQQRIGITSTMLGNIKSIKMSGLSQKLGISIAQLRKDEIDAAAPFRMMSAVMSAIAQVPTLLSPVAAFAFFTIRSEESGISLDATRVFTSLSLILLLGQPLFWILEAVLDVSAALGCFKRIENFLLKASRTENRTLVFELRELTTASHDQNGVNVAIHNASFSWSASGPASLEIVHMDIKKGQLVIVTGPVASGKTTLLKGLLGELPSITGRVELAHQKIAWCDQTPWLVNDTILKNIIGYTRYDENLYRSVTFACDLNKDFASLEIGDKTIVGSKGIMLSGGQKQRVALARAVYSRPRIAFFDDPFSSLDNHTAQIVFNRIFGKKTGLLRQWGTTVILVTQSSKFLPDADKVVSLIEGSIAEQGTFTSLARAGGYVESLCNEISAPNEQDCHGTLNQAHQQGEEVSKMHLTPLSAASPADKRRQQGDFSTYSYFFSTIGLHFTTGLLVCEVSWAFLSTFPTVWLKWWADANAEEPNHRIGYYLGVYASLQTLAVTCFGVLILFGMFFVASRIGIRLHQKLLDAVIRAPLSLFTATDIGSITTRFSQDIGLLDRSLPLALLISIANFLMVIGQAGLLASSTGYAAIAFPFLIILFFYIQRSYLRTSRQLRLLDLEEKAPVYTQFLETLSGLITIRAFGWSSPALLVNHSLIDKSQRPFYLLLMVQQWLALVLNLITAAFAVLIAGLAVKLRDSVSAGLTGVSLVQLITLAETLKLLIQFWTSLETSFGAVARIKHFSEETPDERLPGEDQQPPEDWPAQGHIEALDNIDLNIEAGQKVGVVGRTGSGKSTFLLTLLRLLPQCSGTITIDGINISTLARDKVRSSIITVSQDTFFLPGSVRLNIDPYDVAPSEAIEAVLRRVGLWDVIMERGGLEAKFDDNIFSYGQRQLFSLARAVLRKATSRVVVFDEATSSIDAHTDAVIRQFLHEEFQQHTVIWVAHRLETIMDFDRVIVLEKGCIVEDGSPRELIAAGGNMYSELWNARQRLE